MKVIPIPMNENNFYRVFLEAIRFIPPINKLRPKELDVLTEIIKTNIELKHLDIDTRYIIINSTENKKKMREEINISEASFNNNISILRKHKILTKESRLSPFFNGIEYEDGFKIGFVFKKK